MLRTQSVCAFQFHHQLTLNYDIRQIIPNALAFINHFHRRCVSARIPRNRNSLTSARSINFLKNPVPNVFATSKTAPITFSLKAEFKSVVISENQCLSHAITLSLFLSV